MFPNADYSSAAEYIYAEAISRNTFSPTPYPSSLLVLKSWHCIVTRAFNLYLIQMLDNIVLELDCSFLAMQVAETYWHLG